MALRAKKRYTRIIVLIVESSATYSFLLLLFAISSVVPALGQPNFPAGNFYTYVEAFLGVASGLVPTVMVFMLAIKEENTDSEISNVTADVSDLNFNHRQAGHESKSPGTETTNSALNTTMGNENRRSQDVNFQDPVNERKCD
uniref:Uncharacterized protein n=1 Tax=Psilocybe cubensis TaxID=181762 RepID=A0A8H7XPD4_PSICU